MCGIVGFVSKPGVALNPRLSYRLIKESKIRGLHSFGIATDNIVQKYSSFPSEEQLYNFLRKDAFIFHSRYCTSGDWRDMKNNQPLSSDAISLVMNGVISMKPKEEYEQEYGVKCATENDSEIFLRLLERSSEEAIFRTGGAWAAIWLKNGRVFAARNSYRPLFWFRSGGGAYLCSTSDIAYRAGIDYAKPVPPNKEFCLNDEL